MRESISPADIAANGELRLLVEQTIDQLPDEFRAVFVLRGLEQLSVQETADSLDLPTGTVKTRYRRGKRRTYGV